jgi:hypothetical protein
MLCQGPGLAAELSFPSTLGSVIVKNISAVKMGAAVSDMKVLIFHCSSRTKPVQPGSYLSGQKDKS